MKKTPRILPVTLSLAAALAAGAVTPAVALADAPVSDGILATVRAAGEGASLLADAQSSLDAAGVEVTGVVTSDDATLTVEAQPTGGQSDEQALAAAQALPGVESAQLNYVYQLIDATEGQTAPASRGIAPLASARSAIAADDPFAQEPSSSKSPNQYWLYATGLDGAWDALPEGAENSPVTIATLDSGAMLDHEDLAANLLSAYAYDVTNKRPLSENASTDAVGHGTAVAGIAAAVTNNATGIAGASHNTARVLPVKVIYDDGALAGQADSAALAAAYDYVLGLVDSGSVKNLRVVNMSLGAYGEDFDKDQLLHDAISLARSEYGILTVCAGGNGDYSSPYTDPVYPGDYEECVSVTALEPDGTNVHWSDYNASKDISAPGRTIWTTYTRNGEHGYYSGSLSGTSLAAPIVSGTVALMTAAEPEATPDDVLEALYGTASPVVDPDDDRTQTSGSHGALDAEAALEHLSWHMDAPSFPDATTGSWYYDPVTYVAANGIMSGSGDGSGLFNSEGKISRADMAVVLYRLLGNGEKAPSCGLTDVTDGYYYTDAVNWCVANGVFSGYANGTFGVTDSLTREQLMTVIHNAVSPSGEVDGSAFEALPDHAATSPWATDAAKWALSEGIVSGAYQNGIRMLLPQSSISRAEVAAIMQRAVEGGVL